ncbi:MAG: PDZ domain-containing protein [Akkermansia sp.]
MRFSPIPLHVASVLLAGGMSVADAADIYVSRSGNDSQAGTREAPLQSLQGACNLARVKKQQGEKHNTILLDDGTYSLKKPLVLHPEDSHLTIKAHHPRQAVISGAQTLALTWTPYQKGIMKASIPQGTLVDSLFIDGKLQKMARYPNANPKERILEGYAPDAVAPERIANWKHPETGLLHTLHVSMWGGMHYKITGKKADGSVILEGGWQNNRPSGPHAQYRYVENIFEELDTPGEWFLDAETSTLYYYPEAGMDLAKAKVEASHIERLIELEGTEQFPIQNVRIQDLVLTQTDRTFMKNKEPLLRSDWTIYRNGAILLEGAEQCSITGCDFVDLGGDAVFVNNYNRDILVKSCYIHNVGGNGVAFVGDRDAVRAPRDFQDVAHFSWDTLDKNRGPKGNNFPENCTVEDCLITRTGRVEKQTAPIEIAMAKGISVINCSLYDVPRAGINIGDGCWGGHLIDGCDVFDTVLETSDHGSFNSWGRDRFWNLNGLNMNDLSQWDKIKDIPFLDVVERNIIRNSRWKCEHGWDIDLDDGSSNYEIYNNLLLNNGLKLREGFGRTVYNNIIVNNSLHPHVWYQRSGDIVERNIFFVDGYFPAGGMPARPWGERMDHNFVHVQGMKGAQPAQGLQSASGNDAHSKIGDANFINAAKGNYTVRANSPALQSGFKNFPMKFGVVSPRLKSLVKTPVLPDYHPVPTGEVPKTEAIDSLSLEGRNIQGMGDISAYGLSGEAGVLVQKLAESSPLYKAGIRPDDVLVAVDGKKLKDITQFRQSLSNKKLIKLTLSRKQKEQTVSVTL